MTSGNRKYMNSTEFKTRQTSFNFFCAQAVEILAEFRAACVKGWAALFKHAATTAGATQLTLAFSTINRYSNA